MLPSLRRLVPTALLLTASGALAHSPLPQPEVPAKEILTGAPAQQALADEQLRMLTRAVESLATDVKQLREKEAERAVHEAEELGPNSHPLWP
jgi:methionine-rich copper-binding protein CopC